MFLLRLFRFRKDRTHKTPRLKHKGFQWCLSKDHSGRSKQQSNSMWTNHERQINKQHLPYPADFKMPFFSVAVQEKDGLWDNKLETKSWAVHRLGDYTEVAMLSRKRWGFAERTASVQNTNILSFTSLLTLNESLTFRTRKAHREHLAQIIPTEESPKTEQRNDLPKVNMAIERQRRHWTWVSRFPAQNYSH